MIPELPPNCPMKKSDYDSYCPSPVAGPSSYQHHGVCNKQQECTKIVKDFKQMNVPKTSSNKLFQR
jgi:hypothetical protein